MNKFDEYEFRNGLTSYDPLFDAASDEWLNASDEDVDEWIEEKASTDAMILVEQGIPESSYDYVKEILVEEMHSDLESWRRDYRENVKAFYYKGVEIFVDEVKGGYIVCYEGETKDGLAFGSDDIGPFETVEEAEQAGRYARDAYDDNGSYHWN